MAEVKMSEKSMRLNPFRLVTEVRQLKARVRELEEELREARQLHQRVAELTDVVQELLLPLSRQDHDKVDDILARYTDQLG